jgi:hypothetical protein
VLGYQHPPGGYVPAAIGLANRAFASQLFYVKKRTTGNNQSRSTVMMMKKPYNVLGFTEDCFNNRSENCADGYV